MRITDHRHRIEREPLLAPFGFKGSYIDGIWQSHVRLRSDTGAAAASVGMQSVLWSDPAVFAKHGDQEGNRLMSEITRHALREAERVSFATPLELLDGVFEAAYRYGREITGCAELSRTFVLNALVPIDHAAWALYARERGSGSFQELVPAPYRSVLTHRHEELAAVPVVSYGMGPEEIRSLLEEGFFVLKIKLGADPERDGDPAKMLEWDRKRLRDIHALAREYATGRTDDGRVRYYLDANGRYDGKDRLLHLLDDADRIGALNRILLLEEPFEERLEIDVRELPVRLAADESVHSAADAVKRIEMGYRALALKPAAKTMSLSLQVAGIAQSCRIPCFCADLTANPLMADWNKNLAAFLPPLPGLRCGLIETNGRQNYRNWAAMVRAHPRSGAPWIEPRDGVYRLDESFYRCSGGTLEPAEHGPNGADE